MGGNALKNCTTRRYDRAEYFQLETQVTRDLRQLFLFNRISPVVAYETKQSFGDMDIIMASDCGKESYSPHGSYSDYVKVIKDFFKPAEVFHNGDVISFEYRQFQIDLIVVKPEHFVSSCYYFAYNDLGNLCGRIAHMMGLKLGHDGLSYNWRIDTYQFRNVILYTEWKDILPVLGLSYERYQQGFKTLEEIFEYVISSLFFNSDIFLLHNRNHTSRVRDAKRKTYMEFLDYVEAKSSDYAWKLKHNFQCPADKRTWLPYLFEKIPEFEQIYFEIGEEWDRAVRYKELFNGELVSTITELSGKELGFFMRFLKERDALPQDFVLKNPHLIELVIKTYFNMYKGTSDLNV